jgi:hypothetical protein
MNRREENFKQYAPATQRNRQPILDVLKRVLPPTGNILEIASGTGEHALFFAPNFAPRKWIPSDLNPISLASIKAWRQDCPTDNLEVPLCLDVSVEKWASIYQSSWQSDHNKDPIAAIVNINMIHISPWQSCLGLMMGAKEILPSGGILYLYGPFKVKGKHTAASNENFHRSLISQNPQWGVRNLDDVVALAKDNGLILKEIVKMPANNLSIVFERQDNYDGE